jgi:hypothetical protein
MTPNDARRRRVLATGLVLITALLLGAGLAAGSEGWSLPALWRTWSSDDGLLIVGAIRAPRTLGAWLTGALLGLSGAVAQGLSAIRSPIPICSARRRRVARGRARARGEHARRARDQLRDRRRAGPLRPGRRRLRRPRCSASC